MGKPELLDEQRYFASTEVICHLLDISRDTLIEWEKTGKIMENLHFTRLGCHRRYSVPLMVDRVQNFQDDRAHERAIMVYVQRQLSNQPLAQKRRSA